MFTYTMYSTYKDAKITIQPPFYFIIYSLNRYQRNSYHLLHAYYIEGTIPGTTCTSVNKSRCGSTLLALTILVKGDRT